LIYNSDPADPYHNSHDSAEGVTTIENIQYLGQMDVTVNGL